jgi:hypothetical protein
VNDTDTSATPTDGSLVARIEALEAAAAQRSLVLSALQKGHEALLQRYFVSRLQTDRLERRVDALERREVSRG